VTPNGSFDGRAEDAFEFPGQEARFASGGPIVLDGPIRTSFAAHLIYGSDPPVLNAPFDPPPDIVFDPTLACPSPE